MLISIVMVTVIYCGFYLSVHFMKAVERLKLGTVVLFCCGFTSASLIVCIHLLLLSQLKLLKLTVLDFHTANAGMCGLLLWLQHKPGK